MEIESENQTTGRVYKDSKMKTEKHEDQKVSLPLGVKKAPFSE